MHPGKGYRWLNVGEKIEPGDEVPVNCSTAFTVATWSIGDRVNVPETFRRKLTMLPTDPTPVKRVETPHNKLTPGAYLMAWGNYEVLVAVRVRDGRMVFRVPTGLTHEVYTVPDAKFYRLPKELQ